MVQFVHNRKFDKKGNLKSCGGETICIEMSNKEDLDYMYGTNEPIFLGFAAVKCSKNDNYNKKIGRAVSSGRAKVTNFSLKTREVAEKSIYWSLQSDTHCITLLTNEDSDRVYLIAARKL